MRIEFALQKLAQPISKRHGMSRRKAATKCQPALSVCITDVRRAVQQRVKAFTVISTVRAMLVSKCRLSSRSNANVIGSFSCNTKKRKAFVLRAACCVLRGQSRFFHDRKSSTLRART